MPGNAGCGGAGRVRWAIAADDRRRLGQSAGLACVVGGLYSRPAVRGGGWLRTWLVAAPMVLASAGVAQAAGGYADAIKHEPELRAYWRLGDASGTAAADANGRAPGSLLGGVELGARGGLSADPDTAARFDGVDDEFQAGVAGAGTLEGWFLWESGVAL